MNDDHAQFINEQYETGAAQEKTSTSKHERMARIIQGLLASAEVAAGRGDEGARDEALAKASALQLKFAIDDAMLAVGTQSKEGISEADFCTESNTPLIKAKRILINGLATWNRGKAIMMGEMKDKRGGGKRWDKRAKVRVYAHASDLQFITMLYSSLLLQMQTMMANDERKILDSYYPPARPSAAMASWRVSYAYGWVDRVLGRIAEAARRNEAQAETGQPGTALVLRDRTQLVHDHVAGKFGNLKKTSYRHDDKDEAGRRAGRAAAERADLGGKKIANDRRYLEA